jgi:hypothetical protein
MSRNIPLLRSSPRIAAMTALAALSLCGTSAVAVAGGASAAAPAPAAVVAVSPKAQSTAIDSNANGGDSCSGGGIACDIWLQEQHKKILLRLMATYYALGTGREGNAPQQAEMLATLVSNVVAAKP